MTPEQKQQMIKQAEAWKQKVEQRLIDIGRGDIIQTLSWFFQFWTPTGPIKKVWGDVADHEILREEGEVFDLSDALFIIHKLKFEIDAENWPEVFTHAASLGQALPGAAEGRFFDLTQLRREGGRNSKDVSADDRDERDRLIQAEIDRLCTQRGMSYISACRRVSETIQKIHPPTPCLSYDRIKKITKNPIK